MASLILTMAVVVLVNADDKENLVICAEDFVETKKLISEDFEVIHQNLSLFATSDNCEVEMFGDGKVIVFDEDTRLEVDWENLFLDYSEYTIVKTYINNFFLQRSDDGTLEVLPVSTYGSYFYNTLEYGGGGVILPWTDFVQEYDLGEEVPDEGHKPYEVGRLLTEAMNDGHEFGANSGATVVIQATTKEGKEFVYYLVLIPEGESILKFEKEKPTEQQTTTEPTTTDKNTLETTTDEKVTTDEETTTNGELTDDKQEFVVELESEKTVVEKDEFSNLLKENIDRDVVINSNANVIFTFKKGSMSEVDGVENYDFGTVVDNEFDAKAEYTSNVKKDDFVTHIKFNYSGKLPGKASIKIFVGAEYEGQELYYAQVDGAVFTFIQSVIVDNDGYITVSQDHCSDYIVTKQKIVSSEQASSIDVDENAPKSDNGIFIWIIIFVVVVLLGAGIAVVIVMKKKEQNKKVNA